MNYKGIIKEVENKHNELRNILMDFEIEEYGDAIIDEICLLFGYPLTPSEVEE